MVQQNQTTDNDLTPSIQDGEGVNEAQIIAQLKKGESAAFGQLYDAYLRQIYNFVYFRTHHRETAEDLTSLVFTKALENFSSFDSSKGKLSTWLYQIARNTIIDHYRTFKDTADIENAFDIPSSSNVERDVDAMANIEKVKKYLAVLPKLQRDIVIMRVWDGLSHKEIAEILNISEANSKMTYSRVVAKMNKEVVITLLAVLISKGL